LDYGDTFSPIAMMAFVQLFLLMVALCHWPLYQLTTTFKEEKAPQEVIGKAT